MEDAEGRPPRVSPAGADPRDWERAAAVLEAVFLGEGYAEAGRFRRGLEALRSRGELFLARSGGRAVGTAFFARPDGPFRQVAGPDEAEVHLLAVLQEFRGQGLAAALLRAVEARALEAGFRRGVLCTQPSMAAAQRLYARLGWGRAPGRDFTRPDDGRAFWVYEKALES